MINNQTFSFGPESYSHYMTKHLWADKLRSAGFHVTIEMSIKDPNSSWRRIAVDVYAEDDNRIVIVEVINRMSSRPKYDARDFIKTRKRVHYIVSSLGFFKTIRELCEKRGGLTDDLDSKIVQTLTALERLRQPIREMLIDERINEIMNKKS